MHKTKERILQVAVEYLLNKKDVENLTVRDIAEKAGVNIALINYHFQSKENLMFEAALLCVDKISSNLSFPSEQTSELDPIEEIVNTMIGFGDFLFNNRKVTELNVQQEVVQGNVGTVSLLLPILQNMFQNSKTEKELRIIALQIVVPLQIIFLYPKEYMRIHQIDFSNKQDRDNVIKNIVSNCLTN